MTPRTRTELHGKTIAVAVMTKDADGDDMLKIIFDDGSEALWDACSALMLYHFEPAETKITADAA